MIRHRAAFFAIVLTNCLVVSGGCGTPNPFPQDMSPGVVIEQARMDALHEELSGKVTSLATQSMTGPGLVGVLGGARVKLQKAGTHELFLPLPQLSDGQVPVCYYIHCTPSDAVVEYRLQRREKLNDVVRVGLQGEVNQEIRLEWSSVVLVTDKPVSSNATGPEIYRSATACVQAEATEITVIAERLWPENGKIEGYVKSIQTYIRGMTRVKQPRSLDALGILNSGVNTICTANVNLALALMRAKGIEARAMAVIPPISQQLEMHRIVAYRHNEQWHYFDPSMLHADVPMKPWQTVVMAKTTLADENLAMQPRMSAMVGCPYGQELELLSSGVTLWGQDFFWTIAKPLADFQPDDESVSAAQDAWKAYLQKGVLSPGQIAVVAASNSRELLETLQSR